MKLYSVDLSPFAARVRASIYVKGLDIAIVAPPEAGMKSPEYLALNPLGKVPVLVLDDGTTIPESETIVEYLEDVFPQHSLRPQAPEALAKVRLMARIAELYIWPNLSVLFPHISPKARDQAFVDATIVKVREGIAHLDNYVAEGPFADGKAFTTADCWLIPMLFFIGMIGAAFGISDLIAPGSRFAGYAKTMAANPVAQKLTAEMQAGLVKMRGG
jgi:glutathione S-transferase